MSATMDIQSITKSISTMEAQLGELRKIVTMMGMGMGMGGQAAPVVTEKVKKERKPRSADAKPNPWIDFTKLVRAALVPAAVEKLGAECQQFCKTLKSEQADYASWTPEAIQTRWRTWEKPAKAPTPPASDTEAPAAAAAPSDKPKRVLTDEQKAKMKAGREAAKAKKAAEAASGSASASASEAPAAAEAAASDGEASTSSKKRGRPKGSKNKAPAESVAVAVIAEEYKPLTLGGKKYLLSGDRAYERTDEGTAGTYAGVYDKKTKSITA